MNPRLPVASIVLASSLVLLYGCSSSGDDDDDNPLEFSVYSSGVSTFATTPVVTSFVWIAYLADEATSGIDGFPPTQGTDFNVDGDKNDAIATVLNAATRVETVLDVAVPTPDVVEKPLAWVGDDLYIVVDEALGATDWNGDGDDVLPATPDDWVLLHWSPDAPTLVFVDELADPAATEALPIVAVGTNLFYSSADVPAGAMTSNLRLLTGGATANPLEVTTLDLAGPLSPQIVHEEEGLLFLALDENTEGRNLNGTLPVGGLADTDTFDEFVLALLDGTVAAPVLRSTGLAISFSDRRTFRAKKIATSDWQVGFLVYESDQGGNNLNASGLFSANWLPTQCPVGDTNNDDSILHYLTFASWNLDPVASPARNTGIEGMRRIAIANSFIATIETEDDGEGCDLNTDGDTDDNVVRWTQIVAPAAPILPPNAAANLRALFDVPGGTRGLAEVQNRFVIVASELNNPDIDTDLAQDFDLVGWLSPTTTVTPWDFSHGSGNTTFVGTTWMSEQRDRTRLDIALQEAVAGDNINSHTPPVVGEDTDENDSVPTFASFSGSTLAFPGVAIATSSANAGIVVGNTLGFYRVSEQEDSRDWNDDNDETDFVLYVTSLQQGTSRFVGTLNDFGRLAIDINQAEVPEAGVFLSEESTIGAGADLNGDLDTGDIVVQFFRF